MPAENHCPTAAIGIVFDETSTNILLVKRRDVPVWVLPGGGVETGEEPENAVLREIAEETACKAEIVRKAAEYTPCNRLSCLTYVFETRYIDGIPSKSSEAADCRFFPVKSLPENFFIIHNGWLKEILENDRIVIRRPLIEVNYTALIIGFFKHPILICRALLARWGRPFNSS